MDHRSRVGIVVIGLGNVGCAVVNQLRAWQVHQLRIIGLGDRSILRYEPDGFADSILERVVAAKRAGQGLRDVSTLGTEIADIREIASETTIFIDATADKEMGVIWRDALSLRAGVVLANKHPLCDSWADVAAFIQQPRLRYEATVGAGLPVISTLRRFMATGDRIDRISATLSGTLGFVLASLSRGTSFSDAVVVAIDRGYAEPDPREDLKGADVARKALILARTLGRGFELSEISPQSLFPPELNDVELVKFLDALPDSDAALAQRAHNADRAGKVPVYLAEVSKQGMSVGLTDVDRKSPFCRPGGTNCRIEFYSEHYGQEAMAISGSGAGAQVTASGILGDLLELLANHENTEVRR